MLLHILSSVVIKAFVLEDEKDKNALKKHCAHKNPILPLLILVTAGLSYAS